MQYTWILTDCENGLRKVLVISTDNDDQHCGAHKIIAWILECFEGGSFNFEMEEIKKGMPFNLHKISAIFDGKTKYVAEQTTSLWFQ